MKKDQLFAAQTEKSAADFAKSLGKVLQKNGFIINNESTMDMAQAFQAHGAEVAPGFDLHMIQICKPDKAAKSLGANPERAILMPKFVMVFTGDGKTEIRFLSYSEEDIRGVVEDDVFPGTLAETYVKIRSMIEEAR
ncbi:MAG: DUF302 domain-containing protein [Proteobacteria bacterium]|nr:DUF302 domain-containing protein [Pseudomonadota bacterium]MBU4294316.1 DUF302 domain-containing protein [Pseudomonadota bacterium]MCG2746129.1 DUF302 domain-containing protein [Desulfobulbaceae bacterium]